MGRCAAEWIVKTPDVFEGLLGRLLRLPLLGVEDRFAEWFGAARIFGLVCSVGVIRDADGIIYHMAFGHVAVGHFQNDVGERAALQALFEGAGIECDCPQSLLEGRWRKLGWNLPFNGLTLLYDCSTDAIVRDPQRRAFALELARECVVIGNLGLAANGLDGRIEDDWALVQMQRTDTMGAYAPSTLLNARAGHALEIDTMFLEPARRAKRLGAPAPALFELIDGLRRRHGWPSRYGRQAPLALGSAARSAGHVWG